MLLDLVDRAWQALLRVRLVTVVATVVAVTTVAVVVARRGASDDDPRAGSRQIADEGRAVVARDEPATYRIVYRIENRAAGELEVQTEEVVVARPFDGRSAQASGESVGRQGSATVTVTRFGLLGVESPSAQPVVLNVAPNPPVADNRPAAMVEAAVDAGLAERRERRRVEGVQRDCTVYRIGGPIGGGELTPIGSEEGEHADVCVSDDGLVLEEVWVVDGDRVLRRRLAVDVDLDPDIDRASFDLPDVAAPPVDQGGGSILEVRADSRPPAKTFYEMRDTPGGFEHRGRYAVVPPQAENFADPTRRSHRIAAVTDVWVAGPDFVAIEQGGTAGGVEPFERHAHSQDVDLPGLGEGELILGFRTSEVRRRLGDGRYLRIYGPVPPATLLAFARRLEPVEGGELVYIDTPPGSSTGEDGA